MLSLLGLHGGALSKGREEGGVLWVCFDQIGNSLRSVGLGARRNGLSPTGAVETHEGS